MISEKNTIPFRPTVRGFTGRRIFHGRGNLLQFKSRFKPQ